MADEPVRVVDARGMLCPMPIVQTNKAMRELAPGQTIKVLATDKGSLKDIPAWAEDMGNEVVSTGTEGDALVFILRKGDE